VSLSKSASYYRNNKDARDKKKSYDTKYHKTAKRREYRSELNKENRRRGTYGNGDGKDVSHTKRGTTVLERQSKNRARQGSGGKQKRK
tara:strand:- start:2580 stop:2843 length:264 start_codon:yes stop_codon:yes gene_type:complete